MPEMKGFDEISAEDIGETVFEDTEDVDLDDFDFASKDLFEEKEEDIDTTIPDDEDLGDFDDFDDDADLEAFDEE